MSLLELVYSNGQQAALALYKLSAIGAANALVGNSTTLSNAAPKAPAVKGPPTTTQSVAAVDNIHEQGRSQGDVLAKIAGDKCTTCRQPRHYGPCKKPYKTPPAGVPHKTADFNMGLTGHDPMFTTDNGPSTSSNYHSAMSADSSMSRARDGRPADEQAATGFADLYRHLGIESNADQSDQNTDGLSRVASDLGYWAVKHAMEPSTNIHSMTENRGPTVNVYEEQKLPGHARPNLGGTEGPQAVDLAFGQIDHPADAGSIGP